MLGDHNMFKDMIKKSIVKSQHCQRNWDLSKQIPDEDLEVLATTVTACPSKQNIVFYTPYFITDRNIIEQIYENTDGFTVSYKDGTTQKNSQTLANLLVVFVNNSKYHPNNREVIEQNQDKLYKDKLLSVGVASGYLNLTASMLGYSTGCCTCFNSDAVQKILESDEKPMLLMGVGYADSQRPRREHHNEDFTFPTFTKKMSVIKI